jgi:hypothetical protein
MARTCSSPSAARAKSHNPRGSNTQVESKCGTPNIGYWLSEDSYFWFGSVVAGALG